MFLINVNDEIILPQKPSANEHRKFHIASVSKTQNDWVSFALNHYNCVDKISLFALTIRAFYITDGELIDNDRLCPTKRCKFENSATVLALFFLEFRVVQSPSIGAGVDFCQH